MPGNLRQLCAAGLISAFPKSMYEIKKMTSPLKARWQEMIANIDIYEAMAKLDCFVHIVLKQAD